MGQIQGIYEGWMHGLMHMKWKCITFYTYDPLGICIDYAVLINMRRCIVNLETLG